MKNMYKSRAAWSLLRAAAKLEAARKKHSAAKDAESSWETDTAWGDKDPMRFDLIRREEDVLEAEALLHCAETLYGCRWRGYQVHITPDSLSAYVGGIGWDEVTHKQVLKGLEKEDDIAGEVLI